MGNGSSTNALGPLIILSSERWNMAIKAGKPSSKSNLESRKADQPKTKQQQNKEARERKRQRGLTKDNKCWVCREPLQQPERGRLRLTCSNACRQRRYRSLHGIMSRQGKREKKLVERRRSKPFIERKFNKTFFEPVYEVTS